MDLNANLIRPDAIARHAEIPVVVADREPGYRFGFGLDIASLIAMAGFGFSYLRYLAGLLSPWIVVGVMVLAGVLVGLQALLIKDGRRRFWIMVGQVFAMGIFFYNFDFGFLLLALGLMLLCLWWGYAQTRHEMAYSTEIRFFANTKGVLGKYITGILLFMVLLYVPQLTPSRAFLPEGTFTDFFNWSADMVSQWYPGIPLSGSFGDFAQQIAEHELQTNPAYQALPVQSQSMTIASSAQSLIDSFSKNLGQSIQASDTVSSVMYGYILHTLADWQNKFSSIFLVGWTVIIFVVLRSIGIVFVWIGQLLLAAAYEILLAAQVITVKQEPTTQERIEYI